MTHTKIPLSIHYRLMTAADLSEAHQLSQAVKWPHRIEDWQLVKKLGVGFVAELDEQPIGTALCWHHGKKYASLGMVIVAPKKQGNGIGRKLMSRVIEELGENKNILLFATPSGQPLYESFGFNACGKVHQHQAVVQKTQTIVPEAGCTIRSYQERDQAQMIALAESACGLGRADALTEILQSAQGIVLEKAGEIIGFSLIREFGRGYAIGPVIATSQAQAKILISYWLHEHENDFVRIDIPQECGLTPWLEEVGLPQVDTVVMMVKGVQPEKSLMFHQYALINQALG